MLEQPATWRNLDADALLLPGAALARTAGAPLPHADPPASTGRADSIGSSAPCMPHQAMVSILDTQLQP